MQRSSHFDRFYTPLTPPRRGARQAQNSTQVRGIQQSFYIHSQENGGWFAGVVSQGPNGGTFNPAGLFIDSGANTTFISAGPDVSDIETTYDEGTGAGAGNGAHPEVR